MFDKEIEFSAHEDYFALKEDLIILKLFKKFSSSAMR